MSSKPRLKPIELHYIKTRVDEGETYASVAASLSMPRQTVRQAYLRMVAKDRPENG